MRLITVLPFCAADAARAERLCDLIYWLSKSPAGHALLVAASDVHPEMRAKVRLAAEVAFESVDLHEPLMTATTNKLFGQAMKHARQNYTWPWLWLEPDAVVLRQSWREELLEAYVGQPRRYMGPHIKSGEQVFLSRVAIYPTQGANDLQQFVDGAAPFDRAAGELMVKRSTKSRLIQHALYSDKTVIREDAVVLHSDKTGALVEQLIEHSRNRRRTRTTNKT